MSHVVVLGGGFGGLAAANELRSLLPDGEVTLVARERHFYMGFAKLWDLARTRPLSEGTADLRRLEARGVRFLQADIDEIDPGARRVMTSEGPLEADGLLVALGARSSPTHLTLLAGRRAHDVYDGAALPAIHHDLDHVSEGTVVVSILGAPFKCPPAPYEAALIVDERLRARGVRDRVDVVMTTPQPMTLPVAGVDASRYVASFLGEHDIELRSGRAVKEVDAGAQRLRFDDDSTLDYAVLLGVPAAAPHPVVARSALAGASGWIEPDRHTMQAAFERVYAVGDCTQIPTAKGQLPKAGVFAAAEGVVAARNLAADLGADVEPARFDGHGYCFLEVPGHRVAFVEGDFYAEPEPDVTLAEATEEQFARKQEYERSRLAEWLG